MTAKQETKALCLFLLSLFAAFSAWVAGEALRRLICEPMGNDAVELIFCAPIAFCAGLLFVVVGAAVVGSK